METTHKRKAWINWALFFSTMVVVFLLGLLASSITERKAEKEYVYKPKVKITEWEPRNAVWGENFPREYQTYLQTGDTSFHSKFNGSGCYRRTGPGSAHGRPLGRLCIFKGILASHEAIFLP